MKHAELLLSVGLLFNVGVSQQVCAQLGWQLDTTFRMPYSPEAVVSMFEKPDGSLLLSGGVRFPEDFDLDPLYNRSLVHVFADGSIDSDFPDFPSTGGGGKLTPWNEKIYVATSGVRRLTADGLFDPSFQALFNDPRVSIAAQGDYLVYEDGRVLFAGSLDLDDPENGFVGTDFSLAWFTNTGELDTTRIHRRSNSLIYRITPQADGRILCSAYSSIYESQPVGRIFRILPDGSLDPSLTTTVNAGSVFQFLPLEDGRFYAMGRFKFQGESNFRYLVRFMADGSLDPTFQNDIDFTWADSPTSNLVAGLLPIDDGRLIAYGYFSHINGTSRKSLCVIDTMGNVVDDYFTAPNCGNYLYQGMLYGGIDGITEAANGDLYIYGAYRGFNDGVINDPGQNLISRLKRVDTGLAVEQETERVEALRVYPNPATGWASCAVHASHEARPMELVLIDPLGRTVFRQGVQTGTTQLHFGELARGPYAVVLRNAGGVIRTEHLVLE